MAALIVVVTTLASFLAGAFHYPWWMPLLVVPAAGWGYARVVSVEELRPSQYAQAVVGQAVELYLAFGFGWLIALLFG